MILINFYNFMVLKNIIEKIEKRLIEKKGKFFLVNFETCINWKII